MALFDAHRHLGAMPAFPFYGGPPARPDAGARATVAALLADLDAEGTRGALVLPNYGVPDPDMVFRFNELCLEAAAADDRLRVGTVGVGASRGRGAVNIQAVHGSWRLRGVGSGL